jgi:signal transduction histidine kinase
MDTRNVARPVMSGFAAAFMALALFAAATMDDSARLLEASRRSAAGHASLAALDRLALCLLRAEAAQLRYLAHGSAIDLAEREAAMNDYVATVATREIEGLKDRGHGQHFALLSRLADQHLQRMPAQPALAVAATNLASNQSDLSLFAGVQQITYQIASSKTLQLKALKYEQEQRQQRPLLLPGLLVGVLALILSILYIRIRHELRLQEQAGRALHTAHSLLESQMRQRTDELESANRALIAENAERRHAQAALSELQDSLRQMHARQELVRDEERKRIAREVHDGLGQDLYALRIEMARLLLFSGPPGAPLNERLTHALQHMDGLMKSVRAVIRNLRPEALDLGPVAALRWQTQEFAKRSGIACDFSATMQDIALGEEGALAVFRILQEALANVLRHAEASQVEVVLGIAGEMLVMSVVDDGCGFDMEARRKATSFGLLGLGERVQALQGTIEISTAPGSGTALTVSIPLARPTPAAS